MGRPVKTEDIIANVRRRAEQCRRLSQFSTDPKVSKTLKQMAEEAEADIRKIEADFDPG